MKNGGKTWRIRLNTIVWCKSVEPMFIEGLQFIERECAVVYGNLSVKKHGGMVCGFVRYGARFCAFIVLRSKYGATCNFWHHLGYCTQRRDFSNVYRVVLNSIMREGGTMIM